MVGFYWPTSVCTIYNFCWQEKGAMEERKAVRVSEGVVAAGSL